MARQNYNLEPEVNVDSILPRAKYHPKLLQPLIELAHSKGNIEADYFDKIMDHIFDQIKDMPKYEMVMTIAEMSFCLPKDYFAICVGMISGKFMKDKENIIQKDFDIPMVKPQNKDQQRKMNL